MGGRGIEAKLMKRPKTGPRPAHWKKPPPPPRFLVVKLTTNHVLNGVPYGIREWPTEVRVRADIARTLMESEQRVAENNRRFLEPRDAIITLDYRNQTRVQYLRQGTLDQAMSDVMSGHLPPAFHLTPADMRGA